MIEPKANASSLRKVLKPIHLWAIAVGLVISGEYFGWNYGWGVAGTVGFLIATLIVTILYITFIFSFTELTTSIPKAGGPFDYAFEAFGMWGGLVAGYATLVEFLITPVAIAFALGSYTNFLYPAIPVQLTALCCFIIFTIINLFGIKESAVFSLLITFLAVAELLIYIGIVAPSFKADNFFKDPMPFGWIGVFRAIPFAIWFYLAIEGVAMVAEEVEDPKKNIPKGYSYGIMTLVVLALAVMVFTGGISDWKKFSSIDYPLPAALTVVLGSDNALTKIFTSLGLFGLIASFHGTIIGYSRQMFALGRAGYLPSFLAALHPKYQTPHWSLVAGGIFGCITIFLGSTDQIIVLAALGAVVMYSISMLALFKLRTKNLQRPFRTPFYPYFPMVALVLSIISLIAMTIYNVKISLIFFTGLVVTIIIFKMFKKSTFNADV